MEAIICHWGITAIILALFINSFKSEMVSVARFQADGGATPHTYLEYKGAIPTLEAFSLCFRFKLYTFRKNTVLFSYAVPDFKSEFFVDLHLKENYQIIRASCCSNDFLSGTYLSINRFKWFSFCTSISPKNGSYYLAYKGEIISIINRSETTMWDRSYLSGSGSFFIGQDQNANRNVYNLYRSFSGEMADVYMYKGLLTEQEMINFTLCREKINRESIMSFQNIKEDFSHNNVSILSIDSSEFCKDENYFVKIFPERKTFSHTTSFCHSSGGEVYQPMNEDENSNLFKIANTSFLCGHSTTFYNDALWLGIVVSPSNKTWQNYLTGEIVNYTNFASTENKAKSEFRCVTFYACDDGSYRWSGKWMMRDCGDRRKTLCKYTSFPKLRLRGLCGRTLFDRLYSFSPDINDTVFYGINFTSIRPLDYVDKDSVGFWQIIRKDEPNLKGKLKRLSILHYPIGKNIWSFENDRCNVPEAELMLTACSEGEFSCSDGTCVELSYRCDLRFNCEDGSDEEDCYALILPPKYFPDIPPPTPHDKGTNDISLLLHILNILNFDIESFRIVFDMYIKCSWIDPRLRYKNLKDSHKQNRIEDMGKHIWKPAFSWQGSQNTSCDTTLRKSVFSVLKKSDALPDNDEFVTEDLIFEGSSNPIIWEMKYTIFMNCPFQLSEYPFDIQVCELYFGLKETAAEHFLFCLEGKGIEFYGSKQLLEYELVNISVSIDKNNSMIRVSLTFSNLGSYFIANTFAPTFMMLTVGYLTLYFPLDEFNERIMVSLTALLVQSSFFTELSNSTPKTSYLKKIDKWCVFCISVLFGITVALTVVNFLWKRESSEKGNWNRETETRVFRTTFRIPRPDKKKPIIISSVKLNLFFRIIVPIVSLVYIAWYVFSSTISNIYL